MVTEQQTERRDRMTAERLGPKIEGKAPYGVILKLPDGKVYTHRLAGVYPGHRTAIEAGFSMYDTEGLSSFVEEKPPVTEPIGQKSNGSAITVERSNYRRGWVEKRVDWLLRRGDPYEYTIHTRQGPIYGNNRAFNEWDARIKARLIEGQR